MGSSQQQTSQNQSGPSAPLFEGPILRGQAGQLQNAQGSLPSLTQGYNNVPLQNIPNLTAQQQASIGLLNAIGANPGAQTSGQIGAQNTLNSFLGAGPGAPSTATEAALNEFNALQAPAILSQASLMGQGTSGAALEALATGQQEATVPFMQQDLANQLTAAQGSEAAGTQQYNQIVENITNSLQASGMPYDVAAQQAQALFNQQQQKQQYDTTIQTMAFPLLGQLIGGGSGTSVSTQPKF